MLLEKVPDELSRAAGPQPFRRPGAVSGPGSPPWSLSVPPVRVGQSGGPQPVPMIVPAHTTRHGVKTWRCRRCRFSGGGAPGRLPQKTGRKGIPSPRPPQASRQPGVVHQSYNRAHPPKLVSRTPTVVPERTAGPRRSVRWYPASADDRPRTYHKTWRCRRCRFSGGDVPRPAPTKNRQKRNSKPTASTSIQATRRRTTVVQQSAPAKTRQPNSHTPLDPAILVSHKESQAVCKLHSSSSRNYHICLIKINYCDYNYLGSRETAVYTVYKVLHRRGERPRILILRQISLKVAFVVQSPSRPQ